MLRFPLDQWHYYSVIGEKPREIAARLLTERRTGTFIEVLLDHALERAKLKPEDRRFLQELVYGVVRWELTLDWLIAQKTASKPQKPIVQNLLRLALYQMFWLDRVPSYAAVNETVEIAKRARLHAQAKFINAVLRNYGREAEATRACLADFRKTRLSLGFSHPEWLCRKWEERWGREKTVQLLESNNTTPPTFARVNTLKTTTADLLSRWDAEGVGYQPASFPWIPSGLVFQLLKHPSFNTLASFQEGLFYVQDPSTLISIEMLRPQSGEHILDLCAAPGGKTTYIAQLIKNRGRILAQDLDPTRLKLVESNCARLGVTSVSTDSTSFPPDTAFHRILIDAPCSNTGVMRRRVELRWRVTPEEVRRLSTVQLSLLKSAASRLRPGGTLVYSTCSLEREENEGVIRQFLSSDSRFQLETERQLTPFGDGVDGAYCAVLRWV